MSLILKVISSINQEPKTSLEFKFDESGGTIGRKPSNTWVLPDENRHLSGSHALIEYENGCYFIVDTSTNGVFINGANTALGKGNKQQLEDGFNILMGTFNIHVSVNNNSASSDQNSKNDAADITDDLFSDLFEDAEQHSKNQKIVPFTQDDEIHSNSKTMGSDDPFFEFDEFTNNEKPKDDYPSKAKKNYSELDSFFKPASIKNTTESPSEINNNSIETNDSQTSNAGIPDDWNVSEAEDSFDDLLTGIGEPLINKETNEHSIEEDVLVPKIDDSNIQKTNEKTNFHESSKVNAAFLKGLGVSDKKLIEEFSEKKLFLAGKLLRSALIGTMEVLQSRAEIKNEMRMDMTTIQPIQNNPIKFSIDVDETIKKLLLQDNKSYMKPERAMEEAYDDITSHQLAIISGIQASLTHVLKRFEPENLISRLEENNPISASIPVHRKAKLWEAFESLYDQIEIEAEDDFNRLFGQEFAKAYDEQVEILKKKRSK